MGKRIVVVGAGAIGAYVAAHLIRAGEDVTVVDFWPENVEVMRNDGIHIKGVTSQEEFKIKAKAFHVTEVQDFIKQDPFDIALISVKSYDTIWATEMIKQYMAPDCYYVSLQNCINEERLAGVVGWGKTLGSVVCLMAGELVGPGKMERYVPLGGEKHTVFRVGEVHGRVTPRAEEIAALLRHADSAVATPNLWGERWSKLTINGMRNGLCACTGYSGNKRDTLEEPRWLSIRLGAEAIRVGKAHGYQMEKLQSLEPEWYVEAAEGNKESFKKIADFYDAFSKTRKEEQRPSMGQDILKGRRTEIDYINGLIIEKGKELGIPTPCHEAVHGLVSKIERGLLRPNPDNIKGI
jgi:2-dehydropantoate 2-reductase